jgi:hypothetical protein
MALGAILYSVRAFRELADVILGYTEAEMAQRVKDGALFNVEAQEE